VRRFATVRVRITLAALVVVALFLTVGAFWLVRAQRHGLIGNTEANASIQASNVASTVADGSIPPILAAPRGNENLVQILDQNGDIVATSENIAGDGRISHLQPGADGHAAHTVPKVGEGQGPYRVVAQRVVVHNDPYIVYVARSLEPVDDSIDTLQRLLLLSLPVLLVLLGITTWIVTGRALRPVERMRREVEEIGAEDLHRRIAEPSTEDEIGDLARTMNAMLARLENSRERQRQFVADASHELRSPLTGIRAQLEVDLGHPDAADWQATERDVLSDAIRLQRLVDDLLAVAVVDSSSAGANHREPVDLDEIVLAETRRLRTRTPHQIDTTHVSGAQLMGNPDQLVRVVRNLLDNAARHACSCVLVSLAETDDVVVLRVTDDGSGIRPEARDYIFERFARLDDSRPRDEGGTGLGLAIVHDVVLGHGGTVVVEDGPGTTFTVTLPVAPA
jgi:signal transduction histidine kinase